MSPRSERRRAAAAQLHCRPGDVAGNLAAHLEVLQKAGHANVDLVVFPELSLTGYDLDMIAADPTMTFTDDDTRLLPLVDAASRHQLTILVGAAVSTDSGRQLAALAFTPGEPLPSVHGKAHLHGREKELFTSAPGPTTLDIDGWRIAVAVCYDAAIPAHAARARSMGADVYAASALYTIGQEQRLADHMSDRARDNDMVVLLGQHIGHTGAGPTCGQAGIWGRDGAVIAQLDRDQTGVAIADVTAAGVAPV